MYVHVSTCTNYDLNALTPVVWKMWRWKDVCVCMSRRKNELSVLEQWINIKFCVTLGMNANDTCAILCDVYGEKVWKVKWFWVPWTTQEIFYFEITNEDSAITVFDIKGTVHFEFIPQDQTAKLIMWKYRSGYVKPCVEKGLNFGQTIEFSTITMIQLTRRFLSLSFWPKNRLLKWNTHHVPLTWIQMNSCRFQKRSLP
jgi:hypothetical protein